MLTVMVSSGGSAGGGVASGASLELRPPPPQLAKNSSDEIRPIREKDLNFCNSKPSYERRAALHIEYLPFTDLSLLF
jgi:hypothetical protein